jgi:fumarate hydratase, class II
MENSPPADAPFRIEHDSLGDVWLPASALWGTQTQRAFGRRVSGERMPREVIIALARIKAAAAAVNAELGVIDPDMAQAIGAAAGEIFEGKAGEGGLFDQFPLDVFQTGSGTSTNMNANEVIATLATRRLGRPVHPNDHVNASQSSNDVFPSAVHIAAARGLVELTSNLDHLGCALECKAAELADVVKSGRTHLMDAVPVTLGQEFGGYAATVRHGAARIGVVLTEVCELPLGGTAVGTGLNAPPGFAAAVIGQLADELPLTEAANHFEAAGGHDGLVAASGVLRTIAVGLYKICNDLRLMNSGPRTGLAEISIPELQAGSSIMPGKVNPVICEITCQVCAQVIGNDAAVAFAGAAGNFELNVMIPVIARNLLASIALLGASARRLADDCVAGITTDAVRLRQNAESSPAIVTALNPFIGYEAAAAVAHQALATGQTIRQVVLDQGFVERGLITAEQLDRALDVLAMAKPGQLPGRP